MYDRKITTTTTNDMQIDSVLHPLEQEEEEGEKEDDDDDAKNARFSLNFLSDYQKIIRNIRMLTLMINDQ